MSNWRRVFDPGGTYFFTLVTENRARILNDPAARAILRLCLSDCRRRWPFEILAIVLLPDHLHTLWRLPPGDSAYSRRLGWTKKEFIKAWLAAGGQEQPVTASRERHRRRGVMQRRFWEHCLRDEQDLHRHMDYIHYNPVKLGYVSCARDWEWSSFHRYQAAGLYGADWGCSEVDIGDLGDFGGEPD